MEQVGTKNDQPIIHFDDLSDFESWLEAHHDESRGIWVRLVKKNAPGKSISRNDAVDAALCFGWIDSQAATVDDVHWLQRFTPRTSRSKWSKLNCNRISELEEQGRMRPAGRREVDRAKEDGRWDRAYDSPSNISVPEDLQRELDASPRARDFFNTLDGQNRFAILNQIYDARREDTRQRRIRKFVEMLEEGKKIY